MPSLDLRTLLVVVEPISLAARPAFDFPENAVMRRQLSTGKVCLTLSFKPGPKDLSKGFVFGSDPQTCDVLLARDKTSGISGNHFSINVDWHTGNPLIACLTPDDGTGINILASPDSFWQLYLKGDCEELEYGAIKNLGIAQRMKIAIHNPRRDRYMSEYNRNLQSYFKTCQNAVPNMSHMRLYDPERTPLMISRTRGLTQRQYVTTNSTVGDKVVLCEVKGHQSWTDDPKTFIVKRYRKTSMRWQHHAHVKLCGLRRYRHRYIIVPEDIISDGTEYMPVYLPEPQETLADIQVRGLLTESQAGLLLAQIFEGLNSLHENNIVHGSLYPGSIRIKHSNPWSIKLSDICLHPYVGLDDQEERQLYASQGANGSHTQTPLWDIWSAGVVGLELLSSDGLPPRSPRKHASQQRWTEALVDQAIAFLHHERPSPEGKREAAQFLTRVLKVEFADRLTAKECLQDPWLGLWRMHYDREESPDSDDTSTVENPKIQEGSGEDTETGQPSASKSKGKQPVYARPIAAGPSRTPISKGKQPLHSPRNSVESPGRQLRERSDSPCYTVKWRPVNREDDDTKGSKRSGPSK